MLNIIYCALNTSKQEIKFLLNIYLHIFVSNYTCRFIYNI